jgi:predicted TIM-barrel fold metal-dependent hydrolase
MATDLETIIDADGHLFEDAEGISEYMPKGYKERGPFAEQKLFPPLDHLHSASLFELPPGSFERSGTEGWKSFMSSAGISATVLYPTSALAYGKIASIDWAIAVCRAYNEWVHSAYMSVDPRFKGMALIPMQDPAAAVKELRYAVEELGMPGAMLPSTGLKSHLGSPEYWPIYEEAERLGCALGVHGGCHSGMGLDHMNIYPAVHGLGHPFGIMISFAGILMNGIYDKFPGVKIGFLEGGVSWFLLCLERLAESWATHIPFDPESKYIRLRDGESVFEYAIRQTREGRVFVGCEGGEFALPYAVKVAGPEAFLYSSDFPHEVNRESVRHEIEEVLETDMTAAEKEKILHKNAQRFYGFKVAEIAEA